MTCSVALETQDICVLEPTQDLGDFGPDLACSCCGDIGDHYEIRRCLVPLESDPEAAESKWLCHPCAHEARAQE